MREIEPLLIRSANPPGNRTQATFINSENLSPVVRSDHRREQRRKEEHILDLRRTPAGSRRSPKDKHPLQLSDCFSELTVPIQWLFRGKLHKAVTGADGTIRMQRKSYTSLMGAAGAIAGHAVNSWAVWQYERTQGNWVSLISLRRGL